MTGRGLTREEAARRLLDHGPNELPAPRREGAAHRVLRQLRSPLIGLLLAALAFDVGFWLAEGGHGWPIESAVIALILVLNAGLGVLQEYRSENALARLAAMTAPRSWAVRDGELVRVPNRELVPGDTVRVEAGDRVPADARLLDGAGVAVDESLLTGESLPVEKAPGDAVFSGTLVVRGAAHADVERTGRASAMGQLAVLLAGVKTGPTPIERRLDRFAGQLTRAVALLAVALVVGGLLAEGPGRAAQVLLFAVALAVAAVPEGLPAVLTLALALGVERMARRAALVRRLAAVEALGSVTVIATDKTGTLTENRMDVRSVDSPRPDLALRALVLANDAELGGVGDPLDAALLAHAAANGVDPAALRAAFPRVDARPFDSAAMFTRATVTEAGATRSYLKGAPSVLLARSRLDEDSRGAWATKAAGYAADGYRVLGVAAGDGNAETDLDFLGLVLVWDPPRPEVPAAIAAARAAGIRVVMVTGDHPATAAAVAAAVGIPSRRTVTGAELHEWTDAELDQTVAAAGVFARVAPADKLRLVEALRRRGEMVAVTGDGVNDAPALKRADVGVAMGRRGSDVAREAADVVLEDDNFATIVAAVEEGRSIDENVRKFVRFLFSTNLAEIMVVALGAAGSVALGLREADGALLVPLTAAQILWINLISDGLPALALAFDRNPGVMGRPPRDPAAPLIDGPSARYIAAVGIVTGLVALAGLAVLPQWGFEHTAARSAVFQYMALSQLWLTFPARRLAGPTAPNRVLVLALVVGVALQCLVGLVPLGRYALGLDALDVTGWSIVAAATVAVWLAGEGIARLTWAAPRSAPAPTAAEQAGRQDRDQ